MDDTGAGIEGITMGLPPAMPKVRAGFQPTPFQRPSIDLDRSVRREWRRIDADEISEGDILPGIGRVTAVTTSFVMPGRDVTLPRTSSGRSTPLPVTVYGGENNVAVYDANDLVLVFTRVDTQAADK